MDPEMPDSSADMDTKPSFRKPSNDAANRKYRRHSSTDMSDSYSSDGSPNHGRHHTPVFSKEDRSKMEGSKRKNDERDSDKQTSASYRDYHRHGDLTRHQRDAVEEERSYRRSSRSGQDCRSGNRFENGRPESGYDRARESNNSVDKYSRDKYDRYLRNKSEMDRYSRDKSDSRAHRTKEAVEYPRDNDRHLSSYRAMTGGRHEISDKDAVGCKEQDRYRDRGDRDERKERQRSPRDYKNDSRTFLEGLKGYEKDSRVGRQNTAIQRKESNLRAIKETNEDTEHKRKRDDRENDKHKERYARGKEEEIRKEAKSSSTFHDKDGRDAQIKDRSMHAVEEPSSKKHKSGHLEKAADEDDVDAIANLRQVKENAANADSEAVGSSNSQGEATQDFNAAKVAAMKAAELVNRNLIGGGVTGILSTDQKKKLLWGNKKSSSSEESGNRWDLPLFTDRERQEKFNKLMSLRLPWCVWPTVGREGRSEGGKQPRRQGWQPPSGETEGSAAGLGEAIHGWTPETGWQNCWSWPVINSHPLRWYTLTMLFELCSCTLFFVDGGRSLFGSQQM